MRGDLRAELYNPLYILFVYIYIFFFIPFTMYFERFKTLEDHNFKIQSFVRVHSGYVYPFSFFVFVS